MIRGELAAALLIGLFTLGLGAWRAAVNTRRAAIGFGITLLVGVPIAFLGAVGLNVGFFIESLLGGAMLALGSLLMLIGAFGVLVYAVEGTVGRRWLVLVLLAAAGTAAGFAASFLGWSAGLYGYRPAALAAVATAVLGVVLAVWSAGMARAKSGKLGCPAVSVTPTSRI